MSGPKPSPVKVNQQQAGVDHERHEINRWERIRTRFSVHANVNGKEMGQYDVVVVLTGLNDLKGIFLPFLQDESGINQNSFKEELRKVFMVLSEKMKLQMSKIKGSAADGRRKKNIAIPTIDKDGNERSLECRPLVVIPALPTRPVPMLQYPPLSWFVHLLLELLDEEKRSLSKEYPDDILFIEAPSIEMIAEIEKGQSVLIAKRKAEKLLLDLKDITRQVRDKIEHLIREHVDIHDQSDSESETERHYEASHHNNLTNKMPDHVGSKLISFDRVHPNDDGYDFWGRHIAEGIINAWKHPCHNLPYEKSN
jgi:lysophospholipase L1-like esterase